MTACGHAHGGVSVVQQSCLACCMIVPTTDSQKLTASTPAHFGSDCMQALTAKSCCEGIGVPCEEVDAAPAAWPKAGLSCIGAAGTTKLDTCS